MAIKFNKSKGTASKDRLDQYKYVEGTNSIRLVGDLLARYVYWVKGENQKDIPLECLSFDRETETFNNKEVDHVKEFFPNDQCSWAYAIQGLHDGKLKMINLKKKLLQQIMVAAEDLGDPTDPDTGWDVVFKREQTGPKVFNVEYTLQSLKCKPRALNAEERAVVAEMKGIDDVLPRPTPDAQLALLNKIHGIEAESPEGVDDEVKAELETDGTFKSAEAETAEEEKGFS